MERLLDGLPDDDWNVFSRPGATSFEPRETAVWHHWH
jgi:hypothetical protein